MPQPVDRLLPLVARIVSAHVEHNDLPAQALPDLITGTLSMMFDSIPASLPHIKSGKLRVLAVASGKVISRSCTNICLVGQVWIGVEQIDG